LKRLAAIVLLSIHLFFTGGYTLVFQYFISRADSRMVKQVYQNKIDDKKLVLLKIPVNMPTVNDWTEYETVAGQIQLKDAYYNYVKLKMTRDTMYLVCYANTAKTQLVKANLITAKEFSDVPMSKKSDAVAKKLSALSEYNLQSSNYQYSVTGGSMIKPVYKTLSSELDNPYINSPGKPPNVAC
jgi:hypothetical protein